MVCNLLYSDERSSGTADKKDHDRNQSHFRVKKPLKIVLAKGLVINFGEHSFSTYAKFSEKFDTHTCLSVSGVKKC